MMRATARLKCPMQNCKLFHPHDYKKHLKNDHLKKVYKCPLCVVACFSEAAISKHLKTHQSQILVENVDLKNNILIFYQCEMCPGKLVLQNHLNNHLDSHVNISVYPCWVCGSLLDDVVKLMDHHIENHTPNEETKNMFKLLRSNVPGEEPRKVYRVVQRCEQCLRSFTYKCKYEEINVLPNSCPYKCSSSTKYLLKNPATVPAIDLAIEPAIDSYKLIICPLCKNKINQKWAEVKIHYNQHHKNHKCLDIRVSLPKLDISKYCNKNMTSILKKKRNIRKRHNEKPLAVISCTAEANLDCNICQQGFQSKELLQEHFKSHQDPCMAYQCLECGQSFVVKPSFSTHMVLDHGIMNVDDYIKEKQCYNDNALTIHKPNDADNNILLEENQCKICIERFDTPDD
jgi:hypothetical protein